MNKYIALLKSVGEEVEEKVSLKVNGLVVTCFAGYCPNKICVGNEYPVVFELMIFNDYEVEEVESKCCGVERIENGFSYWIKGRLCKGEIDCGIKFSDEILLSDYGYLDGKFVRVKVDRIDVEFLEE